MTKDDIFDARPSAQIQRLVMQCIDRRMTLDAAKTPRNRLWWRRNKVADAAEQLMCSPGIWIEAIMAYLDGSHFHRYGLSTDDIDRLIAELRGQV